MSQDEILELTNAYFNGLNEGFDTDIQLNPARRGGKSVIEIGENHFDVLAVNSELCFGDVVQSSKTNDKFTSDDFVFHQGFIDGLGLNLNENHIILRYDQGKNLGINPFYISNEADMTPERLEDLAIFLLELLAEGSQVSKAKEVTIKKVLLHYYKHIRSNHSLASLYQFINDKKDSLTEALNIREEHFSVYNFLHILSEYVDGGLYSFLFNVNKDQTYKIEDKQMIVFELDEVKDNKEILSVMLKLIKSAIQRTIWRNRSERGIILFDEFAKQLKFDNVLESVEFYYQAIRKQNGAIGIINPSTNYQTIPRRPVFWRTHRSFTAFGTKKGTKNFKSD